MRGTQVYFTLLIFTYRNTPAYAGNTLEREPRHTQEEGTPPRMRGTPYMETSVPARPRNTPAYAGNTLIINDRR